MSAARASPERRAARHHSAWARLASNPWVVIASIAAGVAVGEWARGVAGNLELIADIYITLLKMVVLPFMVAAVVFSLRKLLADPNSLAILPRILTTFLTIFAIAVLAGLLIGLVAAPGRNLSQETLASMGKLAGPVEGSHDAFPLFTANAVDHPQTLGDILLTLIPTNVFAALTQGDTLKVLVFSLLFGLAVGKTPGRVAESLSNALEAVYQACLTLTDWFSLALPLGLFAIIASQVAETGLDPLRAMFKFVLAYGAGMLMLVLLSLWALHRTSGRAWSEVSHSQRSPLLLAMATGSDFACMPTMIASLVQSLGFSRARIELLVPLGLSLLRIGQVLYHVVAIQFIAQLYGVTFNGTQWGVVVIGSVLAGLASAGMTGVMVLGLTGLLSNYLKLPFEAAMALFIAVDPVLERLQAIVAVAGTSAFAAVSAGRTEDEGGLVQGDPEVGPEPVPGLKARS